MPDEPVPDEPVPDEPVPDEPAGPSATARAVADYRRRLERLEAGTGDAAADDRPSDDTAGGWAVDLDAPMGRYLRARTSFFDRVVVNALDRGVRQMVNVGAGYDGRALRYSRPGVRWFELDAPPTQDDKRSRLARLGIDPADVTFVGADLGTTDVATALLERGFEPEAPTQFWCEGVAVHLDREVLATLLRGLRDLATVGTRLAISLSMAPRSEEHAERRRRFEAAVADVGEPTRTTFTEEEAGALLTACRWRPVDVSERARRVGFCVATPQWVAAPGARRSVAAPGPAPRRASRLAAYMERTFSRAGTERLAEHLEDRYGTSVDGLTQLDVGVFRVQRREGPAWIARVFPDARPLAAAERDASILRSLEDDGFPAERCAHPDAVSSLAGQAVLVTDLVAGARAGSDDGTLRDLGGLLGRLHTQCGPWAGTAPPGGAWHHLALEGGPREEVAALLSLWEASESRVGPEDAMRYAGVRDEIAAIDVGAGLPEAFTHPDFVAANALVQDGAGPTVIDWTGAGRGPRLWSLGFLLWAASHHELTAVDAVMAGYRTRAELEPEELDRLAGVVMGRPLVIEGWAWCTGRKSLAEVARGLPALRDQAAAIADRAVGRGAPRRTSARAMSGSDEDATLVPALRRPAPILPVRDLRRSLAFYRRLGFRTEEYDAGYGFARRARLRLHLAEVPDLDPRTNHAGVYVDALRVEALHAEWLGCGLRVVPDIPEHVDEPAGLITEAVEMKPWGVHEFTVLDPDGNRLRLGRQTRE